MPDDILINVEGVSKKFCRKLKRSLLYGLQDIGSELMGRSRVPELRKDEFWAVNDVSFELKRGECLGLIGHNGAGKSTLLKMLNGLIKPDKGRIALKGRIGALIELGTGFNPILTGRENIYNNGAVLGFTKKEIDQKFDAIVDFAEIGDFIDTPVQNYSSGMKVRLGFSVAAQMEPDVLLVDEVLAVGDLGFRIKCYNEIYKLIDRSSVIFVSHSMPQVGKVCTKAILMKDGTCIFSSDNVAMAIQGYFDLYDFSCITKYGSNLASVVSFSANTDSSFFELGSDSFELNNNPERQLIYIPYSSLKLKLILNIENDIKRFKILYSFSDTEQKVVLQISTQGVSFINDDNIMSISTYIPNLPLNAGNYSVAFSIHETDDVNGFGGFLLGFRDVFKIKVIRSSYLGVAPVIIEAKWQKSV